MASDRFQTIPPIDCDSWRYPARFEGTFLVQFERAYERFWRRRGMPVPAGEDFNAYIPPEKRERRAKEED